MCQGCLESVSFGEGGGETDKCAHWVFGRKLKSQQILFETYIIDILGSVEP